jgi:ABC-2 type transport system permease protein
MLMAGTLRAEATLAAANLVYLVLLVAGASVVPVSRYPDALAPLLQALPSGALGEGLRAVIVDGAGMPWAQAGVLAVWAVGGIALAARFFRWE